MKIDSIRVGFIATNCYLLCDEEAGVCALIDPGDKPEQVADMVSRSGCRLEYILLTHGHFDHTTAVRPLLEKYPDVPVYIHEKDVTDQPPKHMDMMFSRLPEHNQRYYKEGDTLTLGSLTIRVMETPGHTQGSVCYLDPESGDFFAGDACNNNTLLMMDVSATIEEYLEALLALKERQGDIRRFYLFHGPSLQDKSCIDDNIQCCQDILAGTDDRVPVDFLGRPGYLAKERTPGTAAICSESAAQEYGLHILAKDIQNSANNCTRFIAINRHMFIPGGGQ